MAEVADRAGPPPERGNPLERAGDSGSPFAKLPPGPGRPASEVAAHQRLRIRAAMTEIAAADGYGNVTVRELARLAGVSTHTFYRQFAGKQDCLLDTYEEAVRDVTRRIVAAEAEETDWTERFRSVLRVLCESIARHPKTARLVLVEAFAAGSPALARMRRTFALAETIVRDGFLRAPQPVAVPPLLVTGIVAGVICVARGRLLEGREQELPDLAEELTAWVISFRCAELAPLERLGRRFPSDPPEPRRAIDEVLAAEQSSSDRALILAAVAKLSKDVSVEDLSAQRIRSAAGVSRRAFDSTFADIEECFLAAVDQVARRALATAVEEASTAADWPRAVHRALASLCDQIAREPALARLGFTEALALGSAGIRHRAELTRLLADRVRASAPPASRPSTLVAEASIGGAWAMLHRQISGGRAGRLPDAAPALSFMVLAPLIGPGVALEASRP